jgi:ATP-dependent protease HslVU (ClpYQ) peptidase subunit
LTTIAYRYGVLAADSRVTSGGGSHIELGSYKKLHRLTDGSLFAWSGGVADGLKLLAYLEDKDDVEPTWSEGTTGILIDPKGRIWVYEGSNVWLQQHGSYGAWGSGREYAYGAMRRDWTCGAAAAVRVAKFFDSGTGGRIQTLTLEKR